MKEGKSSPRENTLCTLSFEKSLSRKKSYMPSLSSLLSRFLSKPPPQKKNPQTRVSPGGGWWGWDLWFLLSSLLSLLLLSSLSASIPRIVFFWFLVLFFVFPCRIREITVQAFPMNFRHIWEMPSHWSLSPPKMAPTKKPFADATLSSFRTHGSSILGIIDQCPQKVACATRTRHPQWLLLSISSIFVVLYFSLRVLIQVRR